MIDILLVDDNSDKIRIVMEVINEFSEIPNGSVDISLDINDARRKLTEKCYDLLLIDIQLPPHMGKDPIADGGIALLEDIKSISDIKKPTHIIGITSFADTRLQYEQSFANDLLNIIQCIPSIDTWRDQLRNKISYLIHLRAQEQSKVNVFNYDIALITAVQTERTAVFDLPADWTPIKVTGDPTKYHTGIFNNNNKHLKVVTAMQNQMGMQAASVLSMKLIYNFRPKYLIMVGIAAGSKGAEIDFGDILVTEHSWDYGSGKIRSSDSDDVDSYDGYLFQPDPHYLSLDVDLLEIVKDDFDQVAFDIHKRWRGSKPKQSPRVHIGPMASGAAVIQHSDIVTQLIDPHNRKLRGLDMETYGVFYAAHNAPTPRPKAMSIKSVSDYADASKNDQFQSYAAYTSAQFCYYLALNKLIF